MIIRAGELKDAEEISQFLQDLVAIGKRSLPADADWVARTYLSGAFLRSSTVAEIDGRVCGIQIVSEAQPGNPYGVPVGSGTIGTHVRANTARRGVGRAMFQRTMPTARAAGLSALTAPIGETNEEGLRYYASLGFVEVGRFEGRILKRFDLTAEPLSD